MTIFQLFSNFCPDFLTLINKSTAQILAVIGNNNKTSENLNYVIGGLILVVLILIANVLFSKK